MSGWVLECIVYIYHIQECVCGIDVMWCDCQGELRELQRVGVAREEPQAVPGGGRTPALPPKGTPEPTRHRGRGGDWIACFEGETSNHRGREKGPGNGETSPLRGVSASHHCVLSVGVLCVLGDQDAQVGVGYLWQPIHRQLRRVRVGLLINTSTHIYLFPLSIVR